MIWYNSIDLDNSDKSNLESILGKIRAKDCCIEVKVKDSSTKGYHLLLSCRKECDLCRMVFDDQRRFEIDQSRPIKFRNTLFNEKEFRQNSDFSNGDKIQVSKYCERCMKLFSVTSILEPKEIDRETKIKKLKESGGIAPIFLKSGFALTVFLIGYDYFECPKCGWSKFVNRKRAEVRP